MLKERKQIMVGKLKEKNVEGKKWTKMKRERKK